MHKTLILSYKGNREYLHGSDIFNALSGMAAELTGVSGAYIERITFRRFARMSCDVSTEPPADPSGIVCQAKLHAPGQAACTDVWLVETTNPVTSRKPFDEAQLLANATLGSDGRSARLPRGGGYSPIEEVIALTKHLNYAVSPTVNGKWVFGQLDLTKPLPADHQELEIRMKSLVGGRFTVNEILADSRSIGLIRFIVGAP